jgi:hypothetical protein
MVSFGERLMKILSVVFVALISITTTIGCKPAQQTVTVMIEPSETSTVSKFQPASPSILLPSETIAPPRQITLAPSATTYSTITPDVVAPPSTTITPTPTPGRVQPGVYNTGSCSPYTVGYFINVDMCIDQVDVQPDHTMIFYVSWAFKMPQALDFPPRMDMNENKMYLTDNLGNRYSVIAARNWTGDAYVHEGDVFTVNLYFSPAVVGESIFTFFDSEHGVQIPIVLTNPVQYYGHLKLNHYPFVLRYPMKWWQPGTTADGNGILSHQTIKNCTIAELTPRAPQGKLINTIEIGSITYTIYRFYDNDLSVREYLAVDGVEGINPNTPPLLRVTIPFDYSEPCLFDVSDVLANLQQPPADVP